MSRYKWLNIDWPISISELSDILKKHNFTHDSKDGFSIDRFRQDFIEARYIEKIEIIEKTTDPFGEELEFSRVEFRSIAFIITSDYPGLEIINSPRSLRSFLMKLSVILDFRIAIKPVSISALSWADSFKAIINKDIIYDSIQLGSLTLSKNSVAKVVIKSESDVISDFLDITENRKFDIEKIQLLLVKENFHILLSQDGAAKIELDMVNPDLILSLRKALAIA